MTDRQQLRPILQNLLSNDNMSDEERFQNGVLRPIIKMQHDLFIAIFHQYFKTKKNVYYGLNPVEQEKYIEGIFIKNISFRSELIGVIIGQFTVEEYETYLKNASAFNKRMMTILKKRILDSQAEFYLR